MWITLWYDEDMKVKVEINPATGQWRYYDAVIQQYSSEEWPTKKKAFAMSNQYYDVMYKP